MRHLSALLGRSVEAPVVKAFTAELGRCEAKIVVDRHYFKYLDDGVSLSTDDALTVETIFLYGSGRREGFRPYSRGLPYGLRLDWDQPRARAVLGRPSASGGGAEIAQYGSAPRWDRFDFPTHSLHLEYGGAGEGLGISLVTLSTPEATPGRRA